jgi:hypothetical protein
MFLHHKHRINLYYEVHLIIDTSDWLGLSVFKTFWIEYHDVFAILFSILTTNTIIYMHYKHNYVWTLNSDILNFIEHRDVTHNFESVPTKDHFSSIKFLSRRFQCDHYQNMHNLNNLTERKKINRKPEIISFATEICRPFGSMIPVSCVLSLCNFRTSGIITCTLILCYLCVVVIYYHDMGIHWM